MDDIEKTILSCNTELFNWVKDFHLKTNDYVVNSGNSVTVLYERTLSARMNLVLYNWILKRNINSFMVNEFDVQNNTVVASDVAKGIKEVGARVKTKGRWISYCVFDGYFYFENNLLISDANSSIKHLFVEYKLNSKFVYLDLATDYLKFKLFTKNVANNSGFAYVIFDKNEFNPSITHFYSTNKMYYYLIGKVIASPSIPIVNVYLYLPQNILPIKKESNVPSDDIVGAAFKLMEIADEFERSGLFIPYSNDQKQIIDFSTKFNKAVITSKLILKNYSYIKEVWKEANNKKIFSEFENKDKLEVIKDGAKYNKNLENYLNISKKEDAESNGLNASYRTSLNYLILIDYFNDTYLKVLKKPCYDTRIIGRGNNKREIKDADYAIKLKKEIAKHFNNSNDKEERIKKLLYSMLYIIVNLIPILYEENDDGELTERDTYRLTKLRDKFNELLSYIKKNIGYTGKINFDTFNDQNASDEAQLDFLKKIFEYYN